MNADELLRHYERVADGPHAVTRLRRFVVDLAVRGKLLPQSDDDGSSAHLLELVGDAPSAGSSLPRGWIGASVGNLLDFKYGKGLAAGDRGPSGPTPIFGSNGVVGFTAAPLTDQPSIIVGRKGSAGALNICDGPSWTTDVAYYIEPPPYFHLRYLYLALSAVGLDALGKGVKPGLSRSDAYELELWVPPLAEQHRIVAKVDELMALCDRLEAARAEREAARDRLAAATLARLNALDPETFDDDARFALDVLPAISAHGSQVAPIRQAILNLAVSGKLVPQAAMDETAAELLARTAERRFRLVDAGSIPRPKAATRDSSWLPASLPCSWASAALGDLCALVTSGSRGWGEYYADEGPGFVRAQNIRFGQLRLDDLARVNPPKKSEGSRTQVRLGDLLVVITGAGVTNPALLDRDIGEAYVSQHVALVRPADSELSRWLLLCLMAPAGGRAELVARAYGSGKPGLNLDNLRCLSVPIPPLDEQKRIVAKVQELMAVCDQLEASMSAGAEHRSRLLDALLLRALDQAGATCESVGAAEAVAS